MTSEKKLNVCCYSAYLDERNRVMDIVKKHIGYAALGADLPDETPLSFFRELYEGLEKEVDRVDTT